jgi:hypothetical protein
VEFLVPPTLLDLRIDTIDPDIDALAKKYEADKHVDGTVEIHGRCAACERVTQLRPLSRVPK